MFSASNFFNASNMVFCTKVRDSREITEYVKLDPGEYIMVPFTYESNRTASFILGLCSKTETHSEYAYIYLVQVTAS